MDLIMQNITGRKESLNMNNVNLNSDWSISGYLIGRNFKLTRQKIEVKAVSVLYRFWLHQSYYMIHTIWLIWYDKQFRLCVQVYIGSFGHEEWPLFLGHLPALNSHLFPGRISHRLFSSGAPPGGETSFQFYHDGRALEIALFEF